MPVTVSTLDLAEFVFHDRVLLQEYALMPTSYQNLKELAEDIGFLLTEQDADFTPFLLENGLRYDEGINTISFDPSRLDEIDLVARAIVAEYDFPDDQRPTWVRFGLTSDEDCDYSGNYILKITKLLRAYMTST
jgi:hypothetical protein